MTDILEKFKNEIQAAAEHLKTEYGALRVSRATPALVENIPVDYYGAKTPLKQLASITAPEPKILVIEPWDKNAVAAVEKAILNSNLGLSPIVDKNIVRINMPPLSEERRRDLIKIVNRKLEEAKIKSRTERDKTVKLIQDLHGAKKLTEDEKFKMKDRVQKMMDEGTAVLEETARLKEKEIATE